MSYLVMKNLANLHSQVFAGLIDVAEKHDITQGPRSPSSYAIYELEEYDRPTQFCSLPPSNAVLSLLILHACRQRCRA